MRSMIRLFKLSNFLIAVFTVCVVGFTTSVHADVSGARDVVVVTMDKIYDKITDEFDDDEALAAAASEVIHLELLPILHVEKFSKLILASHWKGATAQQRQEFTYILTEFLLRSFRKAIVVNKDLLENYLDNIRILEAKKGNNDDRAMVTMLVIVPSQQERKIDFRMTREDGSWKIYDLVFEGISFAINYRTILNSEIKKSGIETVTANLGEKLNS